MGILESLRKAGGVDTETIIECRFCGKTVAPSTDECPICGGEEFARFEF